MPDSIPERANLVDEADLLDPAIYAGQLEDETPLPNEAASAAEPPRRGRGRPRGATSNKARAGASKGGSLQTQIGAFILTINTPFLLFASEDALDPVEIEALAKALDEECQRSARFRKMVEQALAVQGGTSLFLVVAAIAGRRVLRHNLVTVPEPVGNDKADAALGMVISMTATGRPVNPNLHVMGEQKTA